MSDLCGAPKFPTAYRQQFLLLVSKSTGDSRPLFAYQRFGL